MIFAEFFRMKELPVYLLRSITVTNKSNSLTYTAASACVCTSPLAVTTVVGFFEILTVSTSAELRSFLLTICMFAPRVHHKLSFLRLYCGCGRHNPLIERRIACSFFRFFELKDFLGKFPRVSADASLLSFEMGPQISRRWDCADENFRLDLFMPVFSRVFLLFIHCCFLHLVSSLLEA